MTRGVVAVDLQWRPFGDLVPYRFDLPTLWERRGYGEAQQWMHAGRRRAADSRRIVSGIARFILAAGREPPGVTRPLFYCRLSSSPLGSLRVLRAVSQPHENDSEDPASVARVVAVRIPPVARAVRLLAGEARLRPTTCREQVNAPRSRLWTGLRGKRKRTLPTHVPLCYT